MRLKELVEGLDFVCLAGDMERDIPSLHYDSREVNSGSMFVAIRGLQRDGHDFLRAALEAGACTLVVERLPPALAIPEGVTVLMVPDSRWALARMAANFYRHPSRRMRVVGVTGTNGKTTTTYLIEAILAQAGHRAGVIGTVSYRFAGRVLPAERTTPESLDLQRILSQMAAAGVEYLVMEVSSHSLELNRVAECEFDLAIFTNLTPDHLDFHQDLEHYRKAKLRLFAKLGEGKGKGVRKMALINRDDPSAPEMERACTAETWGFGFGDGCEIRACHLETGLGGTRLVVQTPRGRISLRSPLIGEHNGYNILAAVGAGLWADVPFVAIAEAIGRVGLVPGRWERIPSGLGFEVVVDYAHTPDALERVLKIGKRLCPGKLITVFGCGGDRDRSKRPLMGEVAARWSDYLVLTSDNPRNEDPLDIIAEIEEGVRRAFPGSSNYVKIEDRRKAIQEAIGAAREGDLVIIAGKGHETYQILKDKTIPFDDREVARSILREIEERRKG